MDFMKLSDLKKLIEQIIEEKGDLEILVGASGMNSLINSVYTYTVERLNKANNYELCVLDSESPPENTSKIYFEMKW